MFTIYDILQNKKNVQKLEPGYTKRLLGHPNKKP